MIAVIRRLMIIAVLFGIFFFVQTVQVGDISGINPRTLIVLGFSILASFTFGEIFAFLKLPRVIGYLIIGIVFGPYSDLLFGTSLFKVFNERTFGDLSLVNGVTLSLIALTAGMELKIETVKKSIGSFSLIILFKILFIFVLVPAAVFAVSPFVPFLAGAGWQVILASGLILSVIALGTSIELTLVVSNEAKAKGRYVDMILGAAILKDVVVILLLAVVLTVSVSMLNPGAAMEAGIFLELGKELLFSLIFGAAWGLLIILYMKYVGQELLLFILVAVIFGSELSRVMHLETLLAFVAAGFVVENFSGAGEKIHGPLQKLSMPIFITFFTVAGASINFISVEKAILLGAVVVIIRAAAIFFAVKSSSAVTKEKSAFKDYGWLGFLSIGGLMLGLGILIGDSVPGIGADLKSVITSIVAINIFIGPVLFKFGIGRSGSAAEVEIPVSKEEPPAAKPEGELPELFKEPAFGDERLNKSVFNILFKINNIIKDFEKRFIHYRSEQSVELIVLIIERYTEEYMKIKKVFTTPGISAQNLKIEILKAKRSFYEWFIDLCDERKKVEKNILALEPLIDELFFALLDLTDGLHNRLDVNLEQQWLEIKGGDNFRAKYYKSFYKLNYKIRKLFNKKYAPTRRIHYKNLAKYFLLGESAPQILESVNLVGIERMTTLRKIKSVFEDVIKYFDELEQITIEEKDSIAISTLLLEKLNENHKQIVNELNIYLEEINRTSDEIGSRLRYALSNPYNAMLEALDTAGTFRLDERKFRYSKVFVKSEQAKETSLQTVRYWVNYYLGLIGLFEKEVYINKLKVQLNEAVNESLVNISAEINRNLRTVSGKLIASIDTFEEAVIGVKKGREQDFDLVLKQAKEKHFNAVIDEHLKQFERIHKSRKLNLLIEDLILRFAQIAENLPEEIRLLEENDLQVKDRLPKFSELKSIKIRELSKNFLEKKLPREIGELNELLINHLTVTRTELKNLATIVNFHINTALNENRQGDGGRAVALDLAGQLIQKLKFRIEALNGQIDRLEQNIDKKIIEKVEEVIGTINNLIAGSSVSYVDMYLRKEIKKSAAFNFADRRVKGARRLFRKIRVSAQRNYRNYFKSAVDEILDSLDIKSAEERVFDADSRHFNEDRLQKLPFIYRKLFDGTPLESADFFFGKDRFIEKVKQAKNGFVNNKISSLIIIGEPGSGKRSLLNTIRNNVLSDDEYLYHQFGRTVTAKEDLLNQISGLLGFKRTLSLDEMILYLNDKSRKKIIVVESLNKLFLRGVGGFEALEAFVYLVSMTNKNAFWITTIGKNAFRFVDVNFDLGAAFAFKIRPADFHMKEVSTIVLSRHNATGYDLEFIGDDIKKFKDRMLKIKSRKEEQKLLSEKYFKKLEEYSEGNIISGMYYWLQSIRTVKENTIFIELPRRMSLRFLSSFDNIYMLTLSNILLHGWMTDEEHSKMFNVSIERSRDVLNYLASFSLIYVDQLELYSNKYFPNKFMYRAIENELIKRNIF